VFELAAEAMVVVVEVHMAREKCVMYDVRVSQNGK
jgi:hypothetical protein